MAEPLVPGRRRWVRDWWQVLATSVVVLAIVAGSGVLVGRSRSQLSDERARRSEVLDAARRLAVDLTTYDYRRIDEDVKRVADNAVGRFKTDYATASGPAFQKLIKDNRASSRGEVKAAGIAELGQATAKVLLAVDQEVHNSNTPAGRIDRQRILITLVRQGGRWLVEDVQVL